MLTKLPLITPPNSHTEPGFDLRWCGPKGIYAFGEPDLFHVQFPSYTVHLQKKQSLHNGASNEIKEFKVSKSCPKVRPYCGPIYDPIMFKPFLDDAKLPKFCARCFSLSKQSNIGCIFWIYLWKIMKGWSENYEIRTMYASCQEQSFIVNFTFEIYKYLPNIFITWIIANKIGFAF